VLSAPLSDLNSDMWSRRPEEEPRVPVRDLNRERCSVRLEAGPIDAPRLTVRPMKKEAVSPSEADRDLNSERCSRKLDAEPSEALRFTVRPLKKELERPIELERDLNSER